VGGVEDEVEGDEGDWGRGEVTTSSSLPNFMGNSTPSPQLQMITNKWVRDRAEITQFAWYGT